mgnify:CR=1 FL=1
MRGKKLLKNILLALVYQTIAISSGFIIPKAIIKTYGSSINGLVSSITQFLAYIYLAEGGVSVVIKYLLYKPIAENNKNEIEKILKSAKKFLKHILYIYIIYVLLLCVIYPQIVSKNFETYFTITLVIVIAISRFAEYFMAMEYNLFLQAKQQIYIISIASSISVILNTILTIVLIKLNCSIITIKIANAIVFIVRSQLYKIYVKSKYKIDLSKKIENYEIKQKRDAFVQQLAYIIDTNIDVVLITCFLSTTEVSVYTVYMLVLKGIKNIVNATIGGVDSAFGDMFAKKEYKNIDEKFTIYQFIYYSIITLLYTLCLLLIIPFIQVYTNGITDANYCRPVFAIIVTIGEFIWAIKLPYETIVSSAGHFRQTKNLSCIEAMVNVILSVCLIAKFGIIGTAIGTLAAMGIKALMVVYYFSKNILNRNLKVDLKFLMVILIQSLIIIFIGTFILGKSTITSYISWALVAIKLGVVALIVECFIGFIFYRKIIFEMITSFKEKRKIALQLSKK